MKKKTILLTILSIIILLALLLVLFFDSIYYAIKVSGFKHNNKKVKSGQVVFVGDSITDWYKLNTFYPNLTTYNRGIASDTTQGLIKRFDVSITDLNPKVVVLLIGANDILAKKSTEYIVLNYSVILDKIKQKAPECEVVVQSIYPMNGKIRKKYNKTKLQIVELNQRLMELCGEYGYIYVDVYSYLVDDNGFFKTEYSNDGLHPNKQGYVAITNAINPVLEELI